MSVGTLGTEGEQTIIGSSDGETQHIPVEWQHQGREGGREGGGKAVKNGSRLGLGEREQR